MSQGMSSCVSSEEQCKLQKDDLHRQDDIMCSSQPKEETVQSELFTPARTSQADYSNLLYKKLGRGEILSQNIQKKKKLKYYT